EKGWLLSPRSLLKKSEQQASRRSVEVVCIGLFDVCSQVVRHPCRHFRDNFELGVTLCYCLLRIRKDERPSTTLAVVINHEMFSFHHHRPVGTHTAPIVLSAPGTTSCTAPPG